MPTKMLMHVLVITTKLVSIFCHDIRLQQFLLTLLKLLEMTCTHLYPPPPFFIEGEFYLLVPYRKLNLPYISPSPWTKFVINPVFS